MFGMELHDGQMHLLTRAAVSLRTVFFRLNAARR